MPEEEKVPVVHIVDPNINVPIEIDDNEVERIKNEIADSKK